MAQDTIPRHGVVGPDSALDEGFAQRYQALATIGRGGMGEVRLCRDERIGRDVAMKVVRASGGGSGTPPPEQQRRFLREARIQGQLEHPAIVPVYDLGRDLAGAPFFTMKRVNGKTLEQVLDRLAEGDADTGKEYTRRKLLAAFSRLCLALDYAHERGVLHRDLKPANIMLGHFGEVYLLDWGLAGMHAEPREPSAVTAAPGETEAGSIFGTPNYMSPEQVRGEVGSLDRRTDVYSLGSLLFEILTLTQVCQGQTASEALAETLRGVDARASVRCPDREVPPELEALCVRATRVDRADRPASARELSETIERYLDGDRDLELRRELADRHAALAGAAADQAQADLEARRRALREVGRALALDPGHAGALRTFVRLLTEPPRELPPSAQRDFALVRMHGQSAAAATGFWAYASWFLYLPLVVWMGLKSVLWFFVPGPFWITAAVISYLTARRPDPRARLPLALVVASTAAVASTTLIFGPLIFLPSIAAVTTLSFTLSTDAARRPIVLGAGLFSILLPLGLEIAGLLPPSYRFEGDTLIVSSAALHLPAVPTKLFLLVANLAVVVSATVMIARMRDRLLDTEKRLHLNAWQLRQLVPEADDLTVKPPPPVTPFC
jgi:serine/threonine-protein kinase